MKIYQYFAVYFDVKPEVDDQSYLSSAKVFFQIHMPHYLVMCHRNITLSSANVAKVITKSEVSHKQKTSYIIYLTDIQQH